MHTTSLFYLLQIGLGTEGQSSTNTLTVEKQLSLDVASAVKQGIGAFLFDGLQKTTEEGVVPTNTVSREIKIKLFSHTTQVERQCKMQFALASELASLFAEEGIRTVVLKGIASGTCYPNWSHRPCEDFDCYLLGDYEKGNEVAKRHGATVELHSYKHSHIIYKGLMVENHQFCTALRGDNKMKRFERLLHRILKEEGTTPINGTYLECPSPMFNALFLTHHGREHFIFEGIALRHLCDWAMLLQKHGSEIDWKTFCNYADEYGLRKFADSMTSLAIDYLNIDVPKEYNFIRDTKREELLLCSLTEGLKRKKKGSSIWESRWHKASRLKQNAERFRYFSDTSFASYIAKRFLGIVLDRKIKFKE